MGSTEWQSFEGRMRRRRADRCLVRAAAAIEEDCFEEARERLEEARKLWSSAPGLDDLDKRLTDAEAQRLTARPEPAAAVVEMPAPIVLDTPTEPGAAMPAPLVLEPPTEPAVAMPAPLVLEPPTEPAVAMPAPFILDTTPEAAAAPPVFASFESPPPHRRYLGSAAAVILLTVLAGAFWYGATRDLLRLASRVAPSAEKRVTPTAQSPASAPPAAPDRKPSQAAVVVSSTTEVAVQPLPKRTARETPVASDSERTPPANAAVASPGRIERPLDGAAAPPSLDAGATVPVSTNLPAPAGPPPVPAAPSSSLEPVATLSDVPAPPPATAAAPPAAPVPAPDRPPLTSDGERIRAVLDRYESAYTALDAEAAGAIYPGLDRRALARAFDGLASQRISLGNCNVVISATTALASCAGSATWTPKVGGSSQTAERQWRFELRRNGENWQIAEAFVR